MIFTLELLALQPKLNKTKKKMHTKFLHKTQACNFVYFLFFYISDIFISHTSTQIHTKLTGQWKWFIATLLFCLKNIQNNMQLACLAKLMDGQLLQYLDVVFYLIFCISFIFSILFLLLLFFVFKCWRVYFCALLPQYKTTTIIT